MPNSAPKLTAPALLSLSSQRKDPSLPSSPSQTREGVACRQRLPESADMGHQEIPLKPSQALPRACPTKPHLLL